MPYLHYRKAGNRPVGKQVPHPGQSEHRCTGHIRGTAGPELGNCVLVAGDIRCDCTGFETLLEPMPACVTYVDHLSLSRRFCSSFAHSAKSAENSPWPCDQPAKERFDPAKSFYFSFCRRLRNRFRLYTVTAAFWTYHSTNPFFLIIMG